jgi:hypothetical protein
MKSINLTLNNLYLIINPFHTTCMDRKSTMVDDSIGVSLKGFGESNDRPYSTLMSYRTPVIKKPLNTFRYLYHQSLFR